MSQATKTSEELTIPDSRHERTVRRTATEVRQQFFTLLAEVVADPSRVVLIEHKDLRGHGMLVGDGYAAYVRDLERLVKALSARLSAAGSFRLIGTVELHADVDEAIDDVRATVRARGGGKFESV